MKSEYTKLEPSVLTIASSAMAGQRGRHVFLNECHAAVLTKTNATISELGKTINIDSWGRTAPFPYEMARSTPDTSFDGRGNAGGKPGYQWYTKIEVPCQNFRAALVDWRQGEEELDWGFGQNLSEYDLPSQIARLNRMHREISGIDDLINFADGIDLIFRYRRLWTQDKMKRETPVAVLILVVIRDLQKVCQENDWLFEDRAPSLAHKVDCFFADTNCEVYEAPLDLGISGIGALHIEDRTLKSSSRSTLDSENRPNPMRTTPSHQVPPSTLSSWRRFTRLDPDGSDTRTSIRQSDELLPFTRPVRSMSTSFVSWTPPIWLDALVPQNTSCPPSRTDTKVDDVGVERSSFEGMPMLMNGRRSRKPTRLRVIRSTRTRRPPFFVGRVERLSAPLRHPVLQVHHADP